MIQPLYYHTVYIWALFILCLIYVLTHYSISNKRLLKKENNLGISVVLGIIVILFLGLRPLEFAHMFGDTFTYLHMFNLLESGIGLTTDHDKEWLFRNIMEFFQQRLLRPISFYLSSLSMLVDICGPQKGSFPIIHIWHCL